MERFGEQAPHQAQSNMKMPSVVPSARITPRCTVLMYLEQMDENPPEDPNAPSRPASRTGSQKPPRSASGKARSRSHGTRSQLSRASRDPGAEPIGEEDEDAIPENVRSDVQEQSEVPRTVQIEESMGPGNVSFPLCPARTARFASFRLRKDSCAAYAARF